VAEFAIALDHFARTLREVGRLEPALTTAAEGIRVLSPFFAAIPAAAEPVMTSLVQSYFARCHDLGREPDYALLAPAFTVFEQLKEEAKA
jgi:hypothetical protein